MTDRPARYLAALALAVAAAGVGGYAAASPATEPDAAALAAQVDDLEARVADLEDDTNVSSCIGVSDTLAVRESAPGLKHRHKFGVVLWNWSAPGCGPKWRYHR